MTKEEKSALLERFVQAVSPSSRNYFRRYSRAFLDWVGDGDLDAAAVRGWFEHLKKQKYPYADGTLHQAWAVVRRLFIVNKLEWPFHRWEAPIIREQEVFAPRLDPEAVSALVDIVRGKRRPEGERKPDSRHKALLCLSTVWGFRREEMAAMVPAFLDYQNGLLFVETAKRGRQRWHALPEFLVPPLQEWGFKTTLSVATISKVFAELKAMLGYSEREVGWHAIRRAAIKEAYAFANEPQIHTFYRWKRPTSNMPLRSAMSPMVGPGVAVRRDIGQPDREVDELFYTHHPFVQYWR
jgi:hypothetical protein